MTRHRARLQIALSLLLACSLVVPLVAAMWAAPDAVPAPVVDLTGAAPNGAAPLTIQLTPGALGPELLPVVVGESVTFQNDDSRIRTLLLSFPGPDSYDIFLPAALRSGGSRSSAGAAPDGNNEETIVLNPGESAVRVFDQAGNVIVTDADDAALTATLLVAPPPLPQDGPVVGRIIDYATKLPIAGAQVSALDTSFTTTADANGEFALNLPPGEYTIVLFASGYSFANRVITIRPFTPAAVETIELVPLDETVTPIDSGGGTAVNSAGNTNVVFAAGAVSSTVPIRLTDLPVDEYARDFAALPGPFNDGKIPLGFVLFEPDGTNFAADAVWTIDYDGDLPVGTYVPCYYWIEDEARWGEPVDGEVVDLGNGQKGLRATLPHFSSYGFAAAPPPEPQPPQLTDDSQPPAADDPLGPEDNPNEPDQDMCIGSQINLASGELCQTVGTVGLPALGGMATQVTARYYARDINYEAELRAGFESPPGSPLPDWTAWSFNISGQVFTGLGTEADVTWDGTDWAGNKLAPGLHYGQLTSLFAYNVSMAGGGPQTCQSGNCGASLLETIVPWPLHVVRNDLSPWGIGWFSPHDTLLVDAGDWVTIVQGDGRQVVFLALGDGTYKAPPADESTLVKNQDGTWTRTYRDGGALDFNADGRLTRIADRYGNYQQLFYESSGVVVPAGSWGLNTRIFRLQDSSGNQFNYDYGPDGWLETITDSVGRVYTLEHDGDGHLIAFTDPLGQRQEYTYDARSMMTGHTDARQNRTSYVLDDSGRLLTRTWPTGTTLTAVYTDTATTITTDNGTPMTTTLDERGSPIAQFNGVFSVRMTYDEEMRPTGSDAPASFLLYDEDGRLVETITHVRAVYERDGPYDQISRLTTSSGLDTQFGYSGQGALTSITDALGQTYLMTYDAHGQPLSITDPLGNTTSYDYDGRGQVTSITDPLGRTWSLSYDAAGNLVATTDPNGGATALSYDALNRLTDMIDALGGVSSRSYDANGNLIGFVDASGRPISYTYDALNRVTGITYADGGSEQIAYDANGNPVSVLDARGQGTVWAYDAINRPVAATVDNDGSYTYTYDRVGQPVSITVSSADGTGLATDIAYIDGIAGYPIYERQVGSGLPLTATIDYAYGDVGYMRDLGYPVPATPEAQRLVDTYLSENGKRWPTASAPQVACSDTIPGVISQTLTLTDTSGAYCFGSAGGVVTTTRIEPGAILTVGPGVTLAGYLYATLEVQGTLILSGTAAAPVVLQPQNDSTASYQLLVNNDGNVVFDHVEQYKGGFCTSLTCYIPIKLDDNSQMTVRNSHLGIANGGFRLIDVDDNASLNIHDSTLNDPNVVNQRGTLDVQSTGTLSVTNSLILQLGVQSNISAKGVRVNERNAAGVLNGGNTFVPSEGQPSRVYVVGTFGGLIADTTWYGLDRSTGLEGLYFYFAGINISNNATLTILGPQDIQPFYTWNIGGTGAGTGHLRLRGRPDAPVVINRPASQYGGINVFDGGTLVAEHAVLGRSTRNANVFVYGINATAVISSSQLINSSVDGIYVFQGTATIYDSVIAGNAGHGIRNGNFWNRPAVTITHSALFGNGGAALHQNQPSSQLAYAPYNFWGAASGPTNAANPTGTGGAVSDNVNFTPWLPTPGDGLPSAIRLGSNGNAAQEMTFDQDALGRVTRFTAAGYAEFGIEYAYDANNRLLARTPLYGLPFTDTFTYDGANQLLSLDVAGSGGSLLSYLFDHDANGNVTQIDSSADGVIDYTYDALNRLTGVDGNGLTATYTYDAAGNRTSAGGVTYTYDAGGRLAGSSDGVSYAYDAAGNLLTKTDGDGTTTYTWNGRGQLVRIDYPGGGFSSYRYDDAGRRISRRLPDGSQRFYVYVQDMLAQELDASGAVVASYMYDGLDRPVSMWRNGQTYYYILDHLGSTRALVDSSGVVTATYQYDPWGNVLAATGSVENPLRWAGREFDEESGLYYLRFRYYDPAAGRFISRDPLGIRGGMNLYAYAYNNPLTWVDPLGLQPRAAFHIFGRGWKLLKDVDLQSQMRNIMRNLARKDPKGGPVYIFANGEKTLAQDMARQTVRGGGSTTCVDDAFYSVRNRNGQEVAQVFWTDMGGLAAIAAPLSGLGVMANAANGNTGPLLDTLDTMLGMLMPGMMAVNPGMLDPGAGGVPEA